MEEEQGVELRSLFSNVCGAAEFVIVESEVVDIKEDFSCVLRTHLNEEVPSLYSAKCDSWRDKFAREVNCNFIFLNQLEGGRAVFKKTYQCHLGSRNKSGAKSTRDFKCKASLEIKVLIDNRQQRWRDKKNGSLLTKGLDTEIKITFKHTHPVNVVEQVRLLRTSDDSRNILEGYFMNGMSPAAAKAYHEVQILADHTEEEQAKALADASRNPRYSQVHYLYDTWRRERFADRTSDGIVEVLRAKQVEYAERGTTLHIQENPLVIVVLTPIMKRAHEREFAGNIVFVDSSVSCDQDGSVVTFMFAVCKAGIIPIAFIVQQDQTETNYAAAFKAMREAVGPNGFGGRGEPSTFMTADSTPERRGLNAAFPMSVLLLSIFHVCQALWRWLCEKKNGVQKEKRQELMRLFHKVLYAPTKEWCDEASQAVYDNELYQSNKQFKNYCDDLFGRRSDWCLFQQKGTVTKGHNKKNCTEASIRIFKDYILERCKAFNAVALVDFVANTLEEYHHRHLLSFANMHDSKPEMQYRRFLINCSELEVQKLCENVYKVSSGTTNGGLYHVNIEQETCDCSHGIGGRFCKHLCAVHVKSELHLRNLPKLSDCDKAELIYIALGSVHNPEFYQCMSETEDIGEPFSNEYDSSSIVTNSDIESTCDAIPSSSCDKEEIKQTVLALQRQVSRIGNLCLSVKNPDKHLLVSLRRLVKAYSKITTVAQLRNFCRLKSRTKRTARMIPTQSTSRSRRMKRLGSTSGAKRIQVGRSSKLESRLHENKRRPHSLAKNVANNVINA